MARYATKAAPIINNSVKCPFCQKGMSFKEGVNWKTKLAFKFWTCSNYPICKGTRDARYDPKKAMEQAANATVLSFTPTYEQIAIWEFIVNGNGHLIVNSFAGTGKSTTARISMFKKVAASKGLSMYYGCFGKRNVEEFKEKGHPDQASVSTLNSLGYQTCVAAYGKLKKPDDYKTINIVDSVWPMETAAVEKDFHNSVKYTIKNLVALIKNLLADYNNPVALAEICDNYDIEFNDDSHKNQVMALIPKVMEVSNNPQSGFGMDWNDQVYWPIIHKLPVQKFDIVYIDEAQDCNPARHALIIKTLHATSRAVIIGDDFQAIFGFCGSDVNSMPNLMKMLEEQTTLPVHSLALTITQRCPKSIVKLAQQYVPDIKASDNAIDGNIYGCEDKAAFPLYKLGDMVVCRVNAPLLGIAFGLIKMGTKAVVLGRDISEQLQNLIKRMKASSINDLLIKIDAWVVTECAKVQNSRKCEAVCQRVNDQADCIRVLASEVDTVEQIIGKIEMIFADEGHGKPSAAVTLSSIHKAKGLEACNVFWLYPNLTCKGKKNWQVQQEKNLKYVAVTRTKETLFMVYETGKNPGTFPLPPQITSAAKQNYDIAGEMEVADLEESNS